MRADRLLLILLTFVAVLALGYVAYTVSAGVRPGPGAPATSGGPMVRPPDFDPRDQ